MATTNEMITCASQNASKASQNASKVTPKMQMSSNNLFSAPPPLACSPFVSLNTTERRWIRAYIASPDSSFDQRPLAQAAALAKLSAMPGRFVTVPEMVVLREEMKNWNIEFSEIQKMQHFAARRPDLRWAHWRLVKDLGVDEFQEQYVRSAKGAWAIPPLPPTPQRVVPQAEMSIEEMFAELDVQTSPREIQKDRKEQVRGKRLKTLSPDLKNHIKFCGTRHKFVNCPYNVNDSSSLLFYL
jgi:hypothetical protein